MNTDTLTNDILQALLVAPADNKRRALQSLLGEAQPEPPAATAAASPLLLSMGDAAALLGVCRTTLWRMIQLKRITPVEIMPGTYRVSRLEIERLAAPCPTPLSRPKRQRKPTQKET